MRCGAAGRSHPFLLTMPAYQGTLAAARCLGQFGVPITMAGESVLAPARWSRHVTRWVEAPPVSDIEGFYDWLLEFGEREPGHVLYPTSDDLAWLIADRAPELGRFYRLYQPEVRTILSLLDKKALHEAAVAVGIDTVPTEFPSTEAQALEAAARLRFPLMLKPRTQIQLTTLSKGQLVERPETLSSSYQSFVGWNQYRPALLEVVPGIEAPMLQVFQADAADSIYSLAGFVARGGERIVARASRKILQRPRRMGVGLCFEEAPVNPALLAGIVRLCSLVGYFGVFEAEFIRDGERLQLIDFNPRFYGQMGFEVARELPLAYLAWLGALGDEQRLAHALEAAGRWREGEGYAYCDRFFLNLVLSLQGLSGKMPPSEIDRWRAWQRERRGRALMVDATGRTEDGLPAVVAAAREVYSAIRHPRAFFRKTVLDGA